MLVTRSFVMIISIITISTITGIVFIIHEDYKAHATFINVPPSMFPLGEVSYFDTNGKTIIITAQSNGTSNMVKVDPTTTFIQTQDFSNGGSNDATLEYTGKIPKFFHIACSISMSATNPNDSFVYGVALNGVPQDSGKVISKLGQTSDTISTAMHIVLELNEGDEIEFYVGNLSGTGNAVIKSLNFVAVSMT